jgi:Spy/CpxP family protein refolding chaperone
MKRYLVVAATLVVGGLLVAQTDSGPRTPPTPEALKTFLTLSDSQVESLQGIVKQQRESARTIFQSLREKQMQLRELVNSGSTDAATMGQLSADIANLRQQLEGIRTAAHDQSLAVLNADQQAKLAQLEAARDLAPTIRQAAVLGLLTPPADGQGPGFGPGFGPGPRGKGAFAGRKGPRGRVL